MSEKHLKIMDVDKFQSIADAFIDRSSQEFGEMPASSFFELLFERMAERVSETVEVEGEIVDNQLVLKLPVDAETAVQVKDNEILIGDRRIVVKLKDNTIYPTAQ
ncbi:MAG: hypothetical protein IPM53_29390 [Anaerolineaceae bacterium]|nr:hypothetical protein [Anaerolineaceae bacterium]